MIKVVVSKQSNYPVDTPKLKKTLVKFFVSQGIVSDAEVLVALVGEKKMSGLGKRYLKDPKLHNVLSFCEGDAKPNFVLPPDNIIHLGEIIVCYPKVVEEAKQENKLIQDKVEELVIHGALHLMGVHHE